LPDTEPDVTPYAGDGLALLAAVVLAIAGAVVVLALLRSKRRFDDELREIVHVLEGLRAGEPGRECSASRGSSLALVADATNRLRLELHDRWAEADAAGERWRALSDAAQDAAILTTDTDGDVRSVSVGASRLFGWEESEVVGRPAAVLFEESSYRDLLPKLARRSLRAQGISTRAVLLRRDGTSFTAEVALRMLQAGGRPIGFMLVVRDVTEQARIEAELRESEQRFRGLVLELGVAVLIVRSRRVVFANPVAARAFAREGETLEGTLFRDRIVAGDLLVVDEALEAVERDAERRDELSCRLVAGDGRIVEARIAASAVEFGGTRAVLLVVYDESAARRTAAELSANEAKLDAVLEAASDGILLLSSDRRGSVEVGNRAACEMLGLPAAELVGSPVDRLLERLRAGGAGARAVADRLGGRVAGELELTLDPAAAAARVVRLRLAELADPSGARLGMLVVMRDLSTERSSEQLLEQQAASLRAGQLELEAAHRALQQAHDQLRARSDELDRANHELRRLDEMKSNLLGNVSHELQTPLVSVRGYTEMVLKERLGPVTDEQRKGLALSLRNIDRLIAMIDNLLAFARTDPGRAQLRLSRFGLRALIEEAAELLRAEMMAKEIELAIAMQEDETQIHGDRDRILEVLVNLLSNAIKFNRQRGKIHVISRAGQSGYAAVTVRDTGIGIPKEALGRIFERHFRVERAPGESAEGSGLGLAIVRDILRMHGCTIHVDSEDGRGAAFTFTLPLSVAPAAVEEVVEPAPAPQVTAEPEADPRDEPRPRLRIIRRYRGED
jgi:PAS domain S-box-containing protein